MISSMSWAGLSSAARYRLIPPSRTSATLAAPKHFPIRIRLFLCYHAFTGRRARHGCCPPEGIRAFSHLSTIGAGMGAVEERLLHKAHSLGFELAGIARATE